MPHLPDDVFDDIIDFLHVSWVLGTLHSAHAHQVERSFKVDERAQVARFIIHVETKSMVSRFRW